MGAFYQLRHGNHDIFLDTRASKNVCSFQNQMAKPCNKILLPNTAREFPLHFGKRATTSKVRFLLQVLQYYIL